MVCVHVCVCVTEVDVCCHSSTGQQTHWLAAPGEVTQKSASIIGKGPQHIALYLSCFLPSFLPSSAVLLTFFTRSYLSLITFFHFLRHLVAFLSTTLNVHCTMFSYFFILSFFSLLFCSILAKNDILMR